VESGIGAAIDVQGAARGATERGASEADCVDAGLGAEISGADVTLGVVAMEDGVAANFSVAEGTGAAATGGTFAAVDSAAAAVNVEDERGTSSAGGFGAAVIGGAAL